MKHLLQSGSLTLCGLVCGLIFGAGALSAWGRTALQTAGAPDFMLFNDPGYLGVELGDIGNDRTAALHLKDNHGAEVLIVDHDAPAGKAGLKVHDVILQLDGQGFDTAEQLRRRLREMPPGRKLSVSVSRNGNPLSVSLQLCDRSKLEHDAWTHHIPVPDPMAAQQTSGAKAFIEKAPAAGENFLASVLPKSLYVGIEMNPVHSQLADYFGVTSGTGLLVESVDDASPAARAGIKAGDVITQVDQQPMRSRGDWQKTIRKHRGHDVQVTVMRQKQAQVLTMSAGKPKKS